MYHINNHIFKSSYFVFINIHKIILYNEIKERHYLKNGGEYDVRKEI